MGFNTETTQKLVYGALLRRSRIPVTSSFQRDGEKGAIDPLM